MKRKIAKSLLIHTKEELKKVIHHYTSDAKKVALHCYDFKTKNFKNLSNTALLDGLSFEHWLSHHLFTLKKGKNTNIQIHTYNNLTLENITQSTHNQDSKSDTAVYYIDDLGKIYKENEANKAEFIKIYHASNHNAKILFDFVKELSNYAKESNSQNLSELVQSFLAKNKGKEKEILTMCIEKHLKEPMLQCISEFEELSFLFNQQSYKTKLDASFQTLIKDIEAICKEGNQQMTQELVACFFNIVNIFDLKNLFSRSNLALMAVDIAFEGAKTLSNILEWVDHKYSFAIAHSILKLLVDDIAPIIYLFQNRILNHTLMIDDKIFIELSGIRSDMDESKAYLRQDLALLVEFEEAIFDDIKKIDLHCTQGKEELQICTQNAITQLLDAQMTSTNNRLAYIESPYFNSAKFVELIKNKEEKNPAEQGYNYLIICNAPYKQNAALNQALLDKLGSKPNYNKAKSQEFKGEILYKAPKNYDERIDYSQYQLNIKDEPNKAFVVSLSPFVFIRNNLYDSYQETKLKFDILLLEHDHYSEEEDYFLRSPKTIEQVLNYDFIHSFFRKTLNKQEFLEKEKELFLQGINCLKEYINQMTIYKEVYKDAHYTLADSISNYTSTEPPIHIKTRIKVKRAYSALEVLCLSLTWYVIKKFYTLAKTDTQKWWKLELGYEWIEIEGERLHILPIKSYIGKETNQNTAIVLCFSKQYKKEELAQEKQVFCIEEFVEELEKLDDKEDDKKSFEEFLKSFDKDLNFKDHSQDANLQSIQDALQNIEKELSLAPVKFEPSEAFKLLLQEFITAFFPFSDLLFDLSGSNISKKLVKAIVRANIKSFREFLLEELGLAYMCYVITSKNISIINDQAKNDIKTKAKAKQINQKAFSQAIKMIQKEGLKNSQTQIDTKQSNVKAYHFSFLKDYGKSTLIEFAKSFTQNLAPNLFNQAYTTHYERTKKEYERLKFLKLGYKYLAPYVVKRKEGMFYPMFINNNFFSFNFNNIIIGGKLCTGAFKELDALYYSLQNTTLTQTRLFLLNKLLSYLVLDELRAMQLTDKIIDDIEFFNTRNYTKELPTRPRYLKLKQDEKDFKAPPNASKAQKENIAKFNQTMQAIDQDERRRMLYNEYKDIEKSIRKEADLESSAIDAYHRAMNYLDDLYNDCFNTNLNDNTPNPNKHRDFLRALHIIGQNNIKALYVGWVENEEKREDGKDRNGIVKKTNVKTKRQIRPKFIGRLATTIIMEDGLWIG